MSRFESLANKNRKTKEELEQSANLQEIDKKMGAVTPEQADKAASVLNRQKVKNRLEYRLKSAKKRLEKIPNENWNEKEKTERLKETEELIKEHEEQLKNYYNNPDEFVKNFEFPETEKPKEESAKKAKVESDKQKVEPEKVYEHEDIDLNKAMELFNKADALAIVNQEKPKNKSISLTEKRVILEKAQAEFFKQRRAGHPEKIEKPLTDEEKGQLVKKMMKDYFEELKLRNPNASEDSFYKAQEQILAFGKSYLEKIIGKKVYDSQRQGKNRVTENYNKPTEQPNKTGWFSKTFKRFFGGLKTE